MKKLLFVKPSDSSFIKIDERILGQRYMVVSFLINQKKSKVYFMGRMLSLTLFLLRHFRGCSAIVGWFGDYHAAVMVIMGMLTGKKVIIFAGGQDAICYPELGKGVYRSTFRGRCVKFAFRHASHIIPNHRSLIYHENFYYSADGKKDGIQYYIPGIKTRMTVIPNGIDTERFYRDSSVAKDVGSVLAVGTMTTTADFINKGFDLFVTMAMHNPDLYFTMIGINEKFIHWVEDNYHTGSIPNLRVISFSDSGLLFLEYNRAKVFVQASITEGMPNTLSEAMLCGCVPVGSNVNGIPDAIGDTGILVYKRDAAELTSAVRKALTMNTGEMARQHVLNNFTLKHREEKVLKLFSEILP